MSSLTLLPLDLTGARPGNRITDEQHRLIKAGRKTHRLLIPRHGAFYAQHLRVLLPGGQVLTRGQDYEITYLYRELSELAGRAIYGMVVVTNPNVPATVLVSYRAVGGHFGLDVTALQDTIAQLADVNRPFRWDDITHKPEEYPQSPHQHEWWQVYGYQPTIDNLERVADAIRLGYPSAYAHDDGYRAAYDQRSVDRLQSFADLLDAHRRRRDNPHRLTKTQVGLGLVENYPVATVAEAQAGSRNDRYMTVQRVYDALHAQVLVQANVHYSNRSNPHDTTYDELGAYWGPAIIQMVQTKLDRSANAQNSLKLDGRTVADILLVARTNIPASAFVGMVPIRRLAANAPSADATLTGAGWVSYRQLFADKLPKPQKTFYLGWIEHNTEAWMVLESAYTDLNEYPIGSVALYTMAESFSLGYTNGAANYRVVQLNGSVRTASGWQVMGWSVPW